jgi:hypothetical protein
VHSRTHPASDGLVLPLTLDPPVRLHDDKKKWNNNHKNRNLESVSAKMLIIFSPWLHLPAERTHLRASASTSRQRQHTLPRQPPRSPPSPSPHFPTPRDGGGRPAYPPQPLPPCAAPPRRLRTRFPPAAAKLRPGHSPRTRPPTWVLRMRVRGRCAGAGVVGGGRVRRCVRK